MTRTRQRFWCGTGVYALAILTIATHPLATRAQTVTSGSTINWTGTDSDDWFTATNWDSGSVPGKDDAVLIDTTDPNSTSVSDSQSNGSASASTIIVGNESSGELVIEDGGVVSGDSMVIGSASDSKGQVSVGGSDSSGNGSTLSVDELIVGASGTGLLALTDGAVVDVKGGDGTLVIASETGSTGTVTFDGGTINAKDVVFGSGTGRIINVGGSTTIGANVSGAGSILIEDGSASFTGDSSSFAGTTTVNGTRLSVTGTLGSTVLVKSGSLLTGTGSLTGSVTMESDSEFVLGAGATMNVADITFESGSNYELSVDTDKTASLIQASGDVVINGGYVRVESNPVDEAISWNIVTGDTVTGNFDGATSQSPFIQYAVSNTGQAIRLTAEAAAFSSVADTPNRLAVTTALDSLREAKSSHPIVQGLFGSITEAEALALFDRLSGEGAASLNGALVENGQQVVRSINYRFQALQQVDAGMSASTFGPSDNDGYSGADSVIWVTPFGEWGDTDSTANTAGLDNRVAGFVAGLEGQIGEVAQLGAVAGYYNTDARVDSLGYSSNVDTVVVGGYGGVGFDAFAANAGALFNWHSVNSERTTIAPVLETLSADYNAHAWQLFAEASYAIPVSRATLAPFAGISHINLKTDSFEETSGFTALSAESERTQTTFTTLGVRWSVPVFGNGHIHGLAGWQHALGDVQPETSFTIDASDPFTIFGAPIAKNAFVGEAGIAFPLSNNVNAMASYKGQYGDGATAHGATASISVRF